MKILSWNVNGIRAVLKKGFLDFLKKENPDILCLQETKAFPEDFESAVLEATGSSGSTSRSTLRDYSRYWNPAEKPGYAGVAVFSKTKPLSVGKGIGIAKHDREGRVLTLEYKDFYLVNVYVPNSKRGLERLPYRTKEWDIDFLKHLKKLEKKKPVIFCGDLNVAHKEIDLANPKANVKNHGFTPEERAGFDRLVEAGFVDTFREYNSKPGQYTWWSVLGNCRKKNVGWRIDYFLVSKAFRSKLKSAFILPEVYGSDHCPVGILI